MKHPANHIFEHTPDSLAAWCESVGMPRFRAKQIKREVYGAVPLKVEGGPVQ